MEGHHNFPNITESNGIDITSPEGLEKVKEIFKAQNISPDVPPDSSREQIWLSGNLDTFLATSEDTNGQYALFDLYVPPLAGPVAHLHTQEDEVYQVLDGKIEFQEGTQIREVAPGDLIPLTSGHLHRFENLGTTPARLLLLATPAGLDRSFREAGQPVTDPSGPPPKDDIAKVIAAATKQGIEVYPEASLIGKPIVNDGGIDLYGDQSDETIVGTNGSDLIIGRNGKDVLKGGLGNDILIGGTSDDQLDGGRGNDLLSGREGNDLLKGGGDQDTFLFRFGGGTDTITDFGGVGTGVNPSAAVIAEVDTLQFEGPGLSARNMLLNQDGSDLRITFEGVEQTGVILKDFALENLDNLSKATGASADISNILFDGQTKIEDSFDVFDANQQRSTVFNKNSVTFLNDLNNNTQGFNGSNDIINGQGGNDKLEGLSGDDLLRGGAGNDILIGGADNDILDGGTGDDIVISGSEREFFDEKFYLANNPDIAAALASGKLSSALDHFFKSGQFEGRIPSKLFSDVYTFGDSLSDDGNLNALTEGRQPDFPGFQGRFTNGLVWIEKLTPNLALTIPGNNLAFGGASTGTVNILNTTNPNDLNKPNLVFEDSLTLPGLQTLIDDFLAKNQTVDPKALYTVWAGGADYIGFGLTDAQESVSNLELAITKLADAGAKNFLVPNLFDLGAIPFAKIKGSEEQERLTQVSQEHNQALQASLHRLEKEQNINIINVDTASVFDDIIANPADFGFTNVTDEFLSSDATGLEDAIGPEKFLFWNPIHPTTRAHGFIADAALKTVTSITEVLSTVEASGSGSEPNAGDDLLIGGAGNDTLISSSGNDTLNGSSGDDLLWSGFGNDILIGGAGNDLLYGGKGNDQFVIAAGTGTDTIADFTSTQDLIELSGGLGFSDLTIASGTDIHANDTLLSLTSSNELLAILTGVEASTISSADFSIA